MLIWQLIETYGMLGLFEGDMQKSVSRTVAWICQKLSGRGAANGVFVTGDADPARAEARCADLAEGRGGTGGWEAFPWAFSSGTVTKFVTEKQRRQTGILASPKLVE